MYLPTQYAIAVFGLILLESSTLFVYTVIGLLKANPIPFIIPGQPHSSCQYSGASDLSGPNIPQGLQQYAPPEPLAPVVHTVSVTATTIFTTTVDAQILQAPNSFYTTQTSHTVQTSEMVQPGQTVQTSQTTEATQTPETSHTSTSTQTSETETPQEDNAPAANLLSAALGQRPTTTTGGTAVIGFADSTTEEASSGATHTETAFSSAPTLRTVNLTVVSQTIPGTSIFTPTTIWTTTVTTVAPTP